MNVSSGHDSGGSFSFGEVATALVDADGIVLRWSCQAADLLGRGSAEVCGTRLAHLLAEPVEPEDLPAAYPDGFPASGRALLRHSSGATVEVVFHVLRFQDSAERLVMAIPADRASEWQQSTALLSALLTRGRIGVVIQDLDLTIVRSNVTAELFDGPALPVGSRLGQVLPEQNAEKAEAALRQVIETGTPLIGHEQRVWSFTDSARQWSLAVSSIRLDDAHGHAMGVATFLSDATGEGKANRRQELRHQASLTIGRVLDVVQTAQDLADILVPGFADLAWVELAEAVLRGDEPVKGIGGGNLYLRRAATASATGSWPSALVQVGETIPPLPDAPFVRDLQQGKAVILSPETLIGLHPDPDRLAKAVPEHGHSFAVAPLHARGLLLGIVAAWRTEQPEPFCPDDADLLGDIASHAGLSVDNARRYTREHRTAVTLQQRLLPRAGTVTSTVETVGSYLPAAGGAEIGGDWFDVIPLPSLRVAFVVGDVTGHGLHATATMGRLRTAVQTLADLELSPDELLTHLDGLVTRLAAEAEPSELDSVGATCLVAVHDPISGQCTLASAGHPQPILVRPDGPAELVRLSPGPPLGVGGHPFEPTTLDLPPGSVLALYTDGLLERYGQDLDTAAGRLTDRLTGLNCPGQSLEAVAAALLAGAADPPPYDDIALLLARVHALKPEATAHWLFPADPAAVADARNVTAGQLAAWGLEEAAFATELIVSELVTNAIRYAGGPIGLRLIHDVALICEVTDPSNTQPRLRRANSTDEGGRGLFLVAQLSTRWGSRYGHSGKTIWAEQALPPAL
ncbi:MAG: SpoIIE family protein phosphatase [Nonomuraea sp.]|nr:SpoIIE family protein phosphatase [Nonomuraea sp.]NUP61587.1 SpoIIE family protein phosphatase [Nonomuraea sp.]